MPRANAAAAAGPRLRRTRVRRRGATRRGGADEAFWLERFREPVAPLELPTDRPRPPLKSYRGATRTIRLDARRTAPSSRAGAKTGSTLFVTLLGAFQVLVGR